MNNNRPKSSESSEFEPDKVGIIKLLGSLRIPDIIATITVLASLIGGAYQFGVNNGGFDSKFELYQKDSEITGLRARNSELEAATSKSDLAYKMEIDQLNREITDLRSKLTDVEGTASKDDLDYKHQLDQKDSDINQKDGDLMALRSKIADLEKSMAEKPKDPNALLFTGPTKPDGYVMNADEIGVNYWEYNHRVFYPSTLTVCRESCRIDMQCLAFTFTGTETDGTCYLKPAITGRTTGGPSTLISATKVRSR